MSLTLRAGINATTETVTITGTVPDSIGSGYRFSLGEEILELRIFKAFPRLNSPAVLIPDRNTWICSRAQDGSARTSHSLGTEVFAVRDAWVASTGTTPPDPIVTGGGGITPGPFLEPTDLTPEAIGLWLIDNGFMEPS